ncbi:protein kinase [Yersinia enterocolitica]|uniref:serine/threonine-protein kinase n=1 Tax=Yersinia TaxID=629 RepID=UPI0011A19622|nr:MULTISPECIES: serine/threonine-protein kinase [Yersinia]
MNGPHTIGDLIGERYRIVGDVGEGGMQFVYRAEDQIINREVALKTPKNRSAEKRFKRSAIVAAKVNHPNVAKTLDYLNDGSNRYLIEELIVGKDLQAALLDRTNMVDPYTAAKLFHHLAKGVGAAHHAGVVHRDLKPTNIMVVDGYSLAEIKITDFGIAKMAGEELAEAAEGGSSTMSASQTAVGALPYMAPEVINTPREVEAPADIWSIGAMMYHLICGQLPFGSGLKAVSSILNDEPLPAPDFSIRRPQFSPLVTSLLDLVYRCLQKDHRLRPTADDLVLACSQLCYAQELRTEGVVRDIYHNSWGFITTDSGDVFFHFDSVYGPTRCKEGDKVIFSSFKCGDRTPRAHPVIVAQ